MAIIISQNTTWKSGEFINLTDSIEIAPDVTLTVESGATINGNNKKITNYGSLIAQGTASNKPLFVNLNIATGGYFDPISGKGGATLKFNNVEFNESVLSLNYGKNIELTNSIFNFSNVLIGEFKEISPITSNSFIASSLSVASYNLLADVSIKNNLFAGTINQYAVNLSIGSTGKSLYIVEKNSFLNTGQVAISLSERYSASVVTAKDNYFGTSDIGVINSMLLDRNDSLVYPSYISTSHTDKPDPLTPTQQKPPYEIIFGKNLSGIVYSGVHNDTVIYPRNYPLVNAIIYGFDGIDTVIYKNNNLAHTLTHQSNGSFVVTFPSSGKEDVLSNIERLQFTSDSFNPTQNTDFNIALDLKGNAGVVAKIFGAVLGKYSLPYKEYFGNGADKYQWGNSISNNLIISALENFHNKCNFGIGLDKIDQGMSYDNLAGLALDFSGATTADQVVTKLWTNIVGSAPTSSDKKPFMKMLEDGMSFGALAHFAAEHPLNVNNINLNGLADVGIEYIPTTSYH